MAKAQHGYPLIFELDKVYVEDALACVLRGPGAYGSLAGGGVKAERFVPRLDKIEIGPLTGGGAALQASFHVASGRLYSGAQELKDYALACRLDARVSGAKIELWIDAASLKMTPPGASIPSSLAKGLGLAGSLSLDLGALSIGPWKMTPSEAAVRCDGSRVLVGVLLDIRDGATPFPTTPQKDGPAFQAYAGSLHADDWGYLVDRGLVDVFLDMYKGLQEDAPSGYDKNKKALKDLNWTKVDMDGPKLTVTGACQGHYPTDVGEYWGVTFKAEVWLVVEDSQLKARWRMIEATGPLGINILPNLPKHVAEGQLNTGFPMRLGAKELELGELAAGKVGGSGSSFFVYGAGTAEPCDNAAAKFEPPARPIYVKKGEGVNLVASNEAALAGRRRAPLYIFEPRLENAGAGIKLSAKQQMQVAPGKSSDAADIQVEYSGSCRAEGQLVIANNDQQAVIPIVAYEAAGQVRVAPTQITLTAYDANYRLAGGPGGVSRNPTAAVTISHTGQSPVRCRLGMSDPSGVLFHDGPTDGFVLDKGASRTVRVTFQAMGLTAPQAFAGSLDLYTDSGNHRVGITAKVVHPVGYIPGWKQEELGMIRHLGELRAMAAEMKTLVGLLGKSTLPFPLPIGPRVPWVRVRLAGLTQGASLRLLANGAPCFEGQAGGDQAMLLAPLPDVDQFELALDAPGDAQVRLAFERWDVALLGEGEVEAAVEGMAWKRDLLYVAGANGLGVYRVHRPGMMQPLAALPSLGELVGVHFLDNWLVLNRPGELLAAVAPAPQDVEIVGALPLSGDRPVPLAASGDGRIFAAQPGAIEVYDGSLLPDFGLIGTAEDPALGRELLALGSYLLSLGDEGVCIFDVRSAVPELVDHLPVGRVTNALPLGGCLIVKTEGQGLVVLDLDAPAPAVVGRIEAEAPPHDPLHSPSFLRPGRDGLLAGRGEHERLVRFHQIIPYAVDEEFFAYYAAQYLESPQ